jgi:hypothetical protein
VNVVRYRRGDRVRRLKINKGTKREERAKDGLLMANTVWAPKEREMGRDDTKRGGERERHNKFIHSPFKSYTFYKHFNTLYKKKKRCVCVCVCD